MILQKLTKQKIAHPPKWLPDNTHYLTITGSIAYGCNEGYSDFDVSGFCLPPLHNIFPHLNGEIPGFGTQIQRFEQWQEHHLEFKKVEYDFTVYSIVKYFQLVMDGNPNMIDSLFTADDCVLHCTIIGQMVRDNKHIFLSKNIWPKFRGYARSQLHKIQSKNPEGKRRAIVEKFGYDVKYAYHLVRLLLECEQLLSLGTMDLRRDKHVYKSIRRGQWKIEEIFNFFNDKSVYLEKLAQETELPKKPNQDAIKQLLIQCIEYAYGNISHAIGVKDKNNLALVEIQEVLDRYS